MTQTPEVLIVGAGPVGLTLALALTRLGLDVRIIDRAPATKRQPRACVIWSRSLEILAELGVIDRFLEASFQARQQGHRI